VDPDGPRAGLSGRLNRLRAGVLGANDGITSTAGLVVGVAGATTTGAILPAEELAELVGMYRAKGVSPETALRVGEELTAKDPFAAHFDVELGISPHELINRWHAAAASAGAFVLGSLLLPILLPPASSSAERWPWPSPSASACSSAPPDSDHQFPRNDPAGSERGR
jgi:VIT1/CCC1 family predicted Fe2+/Mn2+ transporter